jgi:hypothetical protein
VSNNNLQSQTGQNGVSSLNAASNVMQVRNTALKPIHYTNRITSLNPMAFVLLIDQSGSMSNEMKDNNGDLIVKSKQLALIVNKFLDEILLTCQSTDLIKNYFDVVIIGYGREDTNGESIVKIAWEGQLEGQSWVNVTTLRKCSLRKDIIKVQNPKKFGPKELEEEINVWIEPYSEGLTPMKEAIETCTNLLISWIENHPNSFPPIVFNMTDGNATDVTNQNEIVLASEKLKSLSTSDGNVLLLNCLFSDDVQNLKEFPFLHERNFFERNAHELALYDSSSLLPPKIKRIISNIYKNPDYLTEETKGVVFANDIERCIKFLEIGTQTLKETIN